MTNQKEPSKTNLPIPQKSAESNNEEEKSSVENSAMGERKYMSPYVRAVHYDVTTPGRQGVSER